MEQSKEKLKSKKSKLKKLQNELSDFKRSQVANSSRQKGLKEEAVRLKEMLNQYSNIGEKLDKVRDLLYFDESPNRKSLTPENDVSSKMFELKQKVIELEEKLEDKKAKKESKIEALERKFEKKVKSNEEKVIELKIENQKLSEKVGNANEIEEMKAMVHSSLSSLKETFSHLQSSTSLAKEAFGSIFRVT